jgi:hypothetical protein
MHETLSPFTCSAISCVTGLPFASALCTASLVPPRRPQLADVDEPLLEIEEPQGPAAEEAGQPETAGPAPAPEGSWPSPLPSSSESKEEDEEPEDCIRREMLEEVGYRADRLTLVSNGYVSPGSSSERIFLYYAPVMTADLVDPKASGLTAEKEDVRRMEFTREDFLARVDAAFFDDAKAMALGFWLMAQPGQGKPKGRTRA